MIIHIYKRGDSVIRHSPSRNKRMYSFKHTPESWLQPLSLNLFVTFYKSSRPSKKKKHTLWGSVFHINSHPSSVEYTKKKKKKYQHRFQLPDRLDGLKKYLCKVGAVPSRKENMSAALHLWLHPAILEGNCLPDQFGCFALAVKSAALTHLQPIFHCQSHSAQIQCQNCPWTVTFKKKQFVSVTVS